MGKLDGDQIEGKLLLLVADVLTVLLLTFGSAISFVSGYHLRTDMGAVLMFCIFSGVTAAVLHRLRQPWAALAAAAGLALIFWITWDEIAPTLQLIGQKMNLIPTFTGLPASSYWIDGDELLPVFLLLCAVLAWLMGWIAVRARRWYLAAMLSMVLVLPAIQSGVLPAWGAMLASFAGWGSMLLTSLYSRKDPGGLARAQLLSLGGITGLIMLLVFTLPMEGYVRPQWATEARTNLITGVTRQLERFMDLDELNEGILADLGIDLSLEGQGGTTGTAGGRGSGGGSGEREDLLRAGPRRYSNMRVLSLRTDQRSGGQIYMRGNALGIYTGKSWEMVEGDGYPFFPAEFMDRPEIQPSLFPSEALDGNRHTMYVRDIMHRGVNYYPYQPVYADGWFSESGWLTMENLDPAPELEYQVDYVSGSPADHFTPLTGAAAVQEETYRSEVVERYYLDVPTETRNALTSLLSGAAWETIVASMENQLETAEGEYREQLEQWLEQARGAASAAVTLDDFGGAVEFWDGMDTPDRFDAVITAASRTAQLLDALAEYDPNTPAMAGNSGDFASYFLNQGRGYCIHFATAGALLLRMQGIPARYVTGYVAQLDGGGRGEALDRDAHAWVEVYINGYGWYPVEMTPGYAGGENGVALAGGAGSDGNEEEPPEEENPEEEPEEDGEQPEEDPEETQEAAGLPGEENAGDGVKFVFPWKAFLGTIITVCALAGLYVLSYVPRNLAKENTDMNRSVISAYRRYSRALKWGGEEIEVMEELARKAKFSQHILTPEEREIAWRSLNEASERLKAGLPKWIKFLYPLIKPLL